MGGWMDNLLAVWLYWLTDWFGGGKLAAWVAYQKSVHHLVCHYNHIAIRAIEEAMHRGNVGRWGIRTFLWVAYTNQWPLCLPLEPHSYTCDWGGQASRQRGPVGHPHLFRWPAVTTYYFVCHFNHIAIRAIEEAMHRGNVGGWGIRTFMGGLQKQITTLSATITT